MSKSASSTPKIAPPLLDTDGPIKITTASLGPYRFLKGRNEIAKKRRWNSWKRGIHDTHIQDFIQYGLTPFLESYGYSVGMTLRDSVSYCKHWAFVHVEKESNHRPIMDVDFIRCVHRGGHDEFDWYLHKIPSEDWYILYDNWQVSEFLDNSDAGYAQRVDLPFFAWRLIHLDSSKAHMEYLDFFNVDEDNYEEISYNQLFNSGSNNEEVYGKGYM